jgi:hypothetical protein
MTIAWKYNMTHPLVINVKRENGVLMWKADAEAK